MKSLFNREKWEHLFYTVSHPVDGSYWIRHQEKGSVAIAWLMVVLFSISFSINRAYAGMIVNNINPQSTDSLRELVSVLLLFGILCVSNWSITCLMDGEGRMKDIVTVVGYSFFPIAVAFFLGTVLSQFVTQSEAGFYAILLGLGIVYGVFMMIAGIMQVHNYTMGKTLITLILTVIAVLIIIFLSLLLVDLITKVVKFINTLITEITLRT